MNLLKIFTLSVLVSFTLFMGGCQGNNSDTPTSTDTGGVPDTNGSIPVVDTNSTKLTVVLQESEKVLKTNSQVVDIYVKVFDASNNPYSGGTIIKVNPNDVLTGRDIGSFDKDTSTLEKGVAHFVYTAPAQLDANTSAIYFSSYHDSNASDARIYTMTLSPEVNQTVLTNYKLIASNENDKTIGLDSTKTIAYSVVDANGLLVPDANVTSITVTSGNPRLVTLEDRSGNSGTTLSSNANAFSINVRSNTISGFVPIKVESSFYDVNNVEQNLTKYFELVVLSGPPTAGSFHYISSEFNATNGIYTENWDLSVVDKYANPVNTNPSVSSGLIVGYAQSSAATANVANYLYYSPTSGGTLSENATKGQFTSPVGVAPFADVDLVNDTLALFGTGYKFNASGLWNIDAIAAANTLDLNDDYNGSSVSSLGFAVGHNFRNETCSGDSVVAQVYSKDNNNTLDDTGHLTLRIEFPDYLVGKSLILWSNFLGGHNNITEKLGYAQKITLVGTGLESGVYEVRSGSSTGTKRIYVYVKDSPHQRVYQNANFGYTVNVTAQFTSTAVSGTSMDLGIMDCSHGGAAYVDVDIIGVAGGDGQITLENLRIGSEF